MLIPGIIIQEGEAVQAGLTINSHRICVMDFSGSLKTANFMRF